MATYQIKWSYWDLTGVFYGGPGGIPYGGKYLDEGILTIAQQRQALAEAFAVWSAALDIEFVEQEGISTAPCILISTYVNPSTGNFANTDTQSDTPGGTYSIIAINSNYGGTWNFTTLKSTYLHEIGHAIGMYIQGSITFPPDGHSTDSSSAMHANSPSFGTVTLTATDITEGVSIWGAASGGGGGGGGLAYVSVADGNWSSSSTWATSPGGVPGVPGLTDIVSNITHNVVVDGNFSLGDDDGTGAQCLSLGYAASGKTLSFAPGASLTLYGDMLAMSNAGDDYNPAVFNTLDLGTDGRLIFASSGANRYHLKVGPSEFGGIRGNLKIKARGSESARCQIKWDLSNGNLPGTIKRGGAGFENTLRNILLDIDYLDIVDAGDDTNYGLDCRLWGSADWSGTNLRFVRSSAKFASNSVYGFSGTLTLSGITVDSPTPVGAFYDGIRVDCTTADIDYVVTKNAKFFADNYNSLGKIVEFNNSSSEFPFPITNVPNGDWAGIWSGDTGNHATLPSGERIILELFACDITGDVGDFYPATNGVIRKLLIPPIRTGAFAGQSPGSIHILDGQTNVTIEQSVLKSSGTNLQSAIYNGEGTEGSDINKILSCKSNIFYGNGYVLKDVAASPTTNNYPAARFNYNGMQSGMPTGTALGVHSSVTSSSGIYNANGQVVTAWEFIDDTANFATWGFTQNGTTSEANSLNLLLNDQSLIDDFFTFMYESWKSTNIEASGTGVTGVDLGVGYDVGVSFTCSPSTIPKNHAGNITITLTGSGTSWDGTTIFTPNGVAGVTKVSQSVSSVTSATIVLTTSSTAGTLTITESVTGTATATVTVATATLSISPTTGKYGTTPTITFTGGNTVWTQETAASLFSVSGGSLATPSGITDTGASAVLTYPYGAGTITITDNSTGATATFSPAAADAFLIALSRSRVAVNTSTNLVISPNGTTAVTFIPHSDSVGDGFTPSTIAGSGALPRTIAVTPTTFNDSPHSISVTDSGSLTDDSAKSLVVTEFPDSSSGARMRRLLRP